MTAIPSPPQPHIREVAIVALAGVAGVFAWSVTHLASRYGFSFLVVSLLVGFSSLRQFAQEHSILHHCGTAVGEVVDYSEGVRPEPVPKHYPSSKIRYRFADAAGTFYHGGSGTYGVPTATGASIEIVYDTRNPLNNMPRAQIWFYKKPAMPMVETDRGFFTA